MNIHIWCYFLRNNPCVKMSIARRCDNAKIMVRWRDTDVAIGHRLTAKVLSHHCHCVIAPSPSHSCTIASSSSHLRAIVISHHCVIFPSTQIVQSLTAWPYPDFMYFDYGLLPLPDLEDRLTVSVTGQQEILTPPNPWSHLWYIQGSVFAMH